MPNRLQLICHSVRCIKITDDEPAPDEIYYFCFGVRDNGISITTAVYPLGNYNTGDSFGTIPDQILLEFIMPEEVRNVNAVFWLFDRDNGDMQRNHDQMINRMQNAYQFEANRLISKYGEVTPGVYFEALRNVANELQAAARHYEGHDEVLTGTYLSFAYNGRTGLHHTLEEIVTPHQDYEIHGRGGRYVLNLAWHFIPERPLELPPTHGIGVVPGLNTVSNPD